jgi:CheY-like chemotaxis protein
MSSERSILIVDSNEGFAIMLKQSLEQQGGGYRATVATSGGKALQVLASKAFDLAVVDLGLTNPDGATLVRQMRQRQADLRLMLIPLGDEPPPELADLDVQGILPKPFFLPELPDLINNALAKSVSTAAAPTPIEAPAVVEEPKSPPSVQPLQIEPASSSGDLLMHIRRRIQEFVQRMNVLAQEVNADTVLLTSNGELIAHTGRPTVEEASELASAIADSWRTSVHIAGILSLEQSHFEQSTEGGGFLFYSLAVVDDLILSVAVRAGVPLGMVRHRTKSAVDALRTLLGI